MFKKLIILVVLVFISIPVFAQSVDTSWIRRYNGPGNDHDAAFAIAVDFSGNVYVTGESYGNGCSYNYLTVKYYPNGDTAWVRSYDGGDGDEASAIAVDDSGYVYVTGQSWGVDSYYDYVTIKYYPNGDTVWIRRYNGPGNVQDRARGIAIDDSGNAYVTGTSGTVKYDTNGNQLWVDSLSGSAIAVDASGNVYVTGSAGTIKYNTYGNQLWIQKWGGIDIVVDIFGNAYVTGNNLGLSVYATIKYYSNGDTAWIRTYNGLGNPVDINEARSISVDDSGNVYVTGHSWSGASRYDYGTIKYYPSGDTAWVRRYNGPKNFSDWASAIGVDNSGNVYVTGYSAQLKTSPYNYDYASVKYDKDGNKCGVARYNGPGDDEDIPTDMVVGRYGYAYVTGWSYGIEALGDYATMKYVHFFLVGDANNNKVLDVSDVIYIIAYLFKGGSVPIPDILAGDTNCDGDVTVTDVIYLINYLFKGGPPPIC